MTTKEFIEAAIEGGYKNAKGSRFYSDNTMIAFKYEDIDSPVISINDIFLDPLSWQAVGKVKNWSPEIHRSDLIGDVIAAEWFGNMHRMINALCEGKTISQYLETL